jgi:hypothetical protein
MMYRLFFRYMAILCVLESQLDAVSSGYHLRTYDNDPAGSHHRPLIAWLFSQTNLILGRMPPPGHTGFQSKELIIKAGLNLGDVDQHVRLDVTIDGADE